MNIIRSYLVAGLAIALVGCGGDDSRRKKAILSSLTDEESAGLKILTEYAVHLRRTEGFPNLNPYQPTGEDGTFRNRLKVACPNVVDASVVTGNSSYSIGSRSIETIVGDKTNRVKPRLMRKLATPNVTSHSEIIYDYTTLDGKTGSIPATIITVDQTIEGQKIRLILSTERTQQDSLSDGEKLVN